MGWLDGAMVGFDTETTGVNPSSDRIVTAAILTRSGATGPVDRRTWLLDPGIDIPAAASAIHGVTTLMAQAEGADPVDALDEIADALAAALRAGSPIVGFNVSYDLAILEADLARNGLATLAARVGDGTASAIRPVVDPLVLDRHLDRWRKGKRKLIDLCVAYGLDVDAGGLHAADADVLATLDLLQAMARAYPAIATVDVGDLHDQQVEAHRVWAEDFRAYLRSRGREDDLPEVAWPLPDPWPPATTV